MRTTLLFVLLILGAGCRTRLESDSLVNLQGADKQYRLIDPIAHAQEIKVSARAVSGKFNIYCFLEKDQAEVEKEIERGKTVITKVPASSLKVGEADLKMTVPANEKAVVLLTSGDGKKAQVKLKISN